MQAGERLDLVANLGVARQVLRLDPAARKTLARFEFRAVVLRLLPVVHQPRGLEGDLPSQFFVRHEPMAPLSSPSRGARHISIVDRTLRGMKSREANGGSSAERFHLSKVRTLMFFSAAVVLHDAIPNGFESSTSGRIEILLSLSS